VQKHSDSEELGILFASIRESPKLPLSGFKRGGVQAFAARTGKLTSASVKDPFKVSMIVQHEDYGHVWTAPVTHDRARS